MLLWHDQVPQVTPNRSTSLGAAGPSDFDPRQTKVKKSKVLAR